MGGGGGGQRDHPVRAKSAGGSTVAAGPRRCAGPAGAGQRDDPRAAVARQASPDSGGGDAGVDHDAAAGSREIPPRLAADVDAGGGVGAEPGPGMRGPALVVVAAGAGNDAGGGAGGRAEIHLTLKSGCRIEALRLESWDSLEKAVVMYTSVAARIVALRDRAQQEPDAPATVWLSEDACAVLVAKFAPGRAVVRLTLGQAVLWIGRLGGHLNRTRDGMPGVRTLWRGLRDLTLLVEGWRVARRLENRCG